MAESVTKAVIPAAGYGTRMLPFTKAVPKELIPLVDTPVLQYVAEEAAAAGVREMLFVISEGKEAIVEHFRSDPELERKLLQCRKEELLAGIRKINDQAEISFVFQKQLNGLGGAVALAEDFVGDDPFLVLLGDTVIDSADGCSASRELIEVYDRFHAPVIALTPVAAEKISSYGIAGGREAAEKILLLDNIVEKPSPGNAPGNLAVTARYLLTPEIFRMLKTTSPGVNNEIQLTDAIRQLMGFQKVYGCCISGQRYDLGTCSGFVAANVEFALRRPELRETLGKKLVNILKEKNIIEK